MGPHRNIIMRFGMEKVEWCVCLPNGEKSLRMFTCFDTIHERDRRTDGQTADTTRQHRPRSRDKDLTL